MIRAFPGNLPHSLAAWILDIDAGKRQTDALKFIDRVLEDPWMSDKIACGSYAACR